MRLKQLSAIAVGTSVAVLATVSAAANAQSNLLVDLGDGPGVGINNSGQVALQNGLYINGTLTPYPMGTFDGVNTFFTGAAINASGQVAGRLGNHAGLYSNGVVADIVPNTDPLNSSLAYGIDDSGTAVGIAESFGFFGAVIFGSGTYASIGDLCPPCSAGQTPQSNARAINNDGIVTGDAPQDAMIAGGTAVLGPHALRYDHGTLTDLFPGIGYAINASGQVAGRKDDISSDAQIPGHAVLYTAGTALDLGVLPGGTTSVGYSLNAAGQVVGASDFAGATNTHAFFYNGVMNDLNSFVNMTDPLKAFVTLTDARGINDNGLIVANGLDSRTQVVHAYLIQAPLIEIAPGSLTYPIQAMGTASSAQTVTLTNTGSSASPLDSISVSGDFAQTNNCGTSLAPGTGCAILVTFDPTATGDRTGGLTITSASVPIVVALAGTGAMPVTPAPANSGGGGGTFDWLSLALLLIARAPRRLRRLCAALDESPAEGSQKRATA